MILVVCPDLPSGGFSGQRSCRRVRREITGDVHDGHRYSCPMELLSRLPELTACKEALSGDRDHAAAAIIAGPPGIGKTSLWRAVADSQSSDAVVLRTTGIPGAQAGLASIADLLDPVIDAALPLMPAPQASALRTALGQISPQAPVTDMLLERAIVGMLRCLAADGVVIAVDDEQWLDEDSRRLLETAIVRLAGVPVRWLISVRSDQVVRGLPRMLDHELGPRAARIDVAELDEAALSELIMARFPGQWSPGVLRQIITLGAGNPYATLEVARETIARGEQEGTTAHVPPSLAAAVRSRMHRLGRQALATVQAAALTAAPSRALLHSVMDGPSTTTSTRRWKLASCRPPRPIPSSGSPIRCCGNPPRAC